MKKEILFSYFPKITQKRAHNLLRAFSSFETAWSASHSELCRAGWDEALASEFALWRQTVDEASVEQALERDGIACVVKDDPRYPGLLKEIYDPPLCLFVRGDIASLGFPVAVVGTRKYTEYGRQVADELAFELARQGISIVSGLALGIDGFAHAAAIRAGGRTVAVLGGGVDDARIAPRAHLPLAHAILAHGGALVSEYPPGFLPTEYSFPRRNRIIAGMSLGAIVVEAPESSGALITARCSLEMDREVFAVPHNITSLAGAGPNNLIKMGAKPVCGALDVLDALNLRGIREYGTTIAITPDTPEEAKLLPHLCRNPVHIDELTKASGLPSAAVSSAMTMMEMKGKVKNLGGMMYVLAR